MLRGELNCRWDKVERGNENGDGDEEDRLKHVLLGFVYKILTWKLHSHSRLTDAGLSHI